MLKERFFFIIKDCILEDDTLVEALYVHVGVWYVFGPNLSLLPPSLARPPVCLYFFCLSLASRAHPLGIWVKVLPWVVDGAGGLGAGKTSRAGTRGVDLNAAIGGRTGDSDTNGGKSSNN